MVQAGKRQRSVGDAADGALLVGGLDQAEVVHAGRGGLGCRPGGLRNGRVGVAADHQGGGHTGGGAVDEHGQAGEVFGVVAQLDPVADQGRVDLVVVAGQADGGGLGDHADHRPAERLAHEHRVGGVGWPAGQEPGQGGLAGLGVDAGVEHGLCPGGEAVVELVE